MLNKYGLIISLKVALGSWYNSANVLDVLDGGDGYTTV